MKSWQNIKLLVKLGGGLSRVLSDFVDQLGEGLSVERRKCFDLKIQPWTSVTITERISKIMSANLHKSQSGI